MSKIKSIAEWEGIWFHKLLSIRVQRMVIRAGDWFWLTSVFRDWLQRKQMRKVPRMRAGRG